MAKKKKITKKITKKKMKQYNKIITYIVGVIIVAIGGYFGVQEIAKLNDYDALPIEEYYRGAEGLFAEELKTFLNKRLNEGFAPVDYGTAKVALAEADKDPNNPTKVITIYSRDLVQAEWISGNSGWTREHVWPNSRLGLDRVAESGKSQASDLHNLRAIVQSVNASRSNKYFDLVTGPESYFPGNEDKGDVARILLYMVVMYPILSLSDDNLDDSPETNYTIDGAKMGKLSVLLAWHKEDPVDDFERARNEVIYSYQKNRNPFIDHPEFVHYIFEGEKPVTNITYNVYYYIEYRKEKYIYA